MRTFLLALTASLLIAAPAYADSSDITTPSDPTFPLFDNGFGHLTVAGTASLSSASSVDILCFYGDSHLTAMTDVPVTDGAFSASINLNTVDDYACRLRAVPHGVVPADLEPYAGPRIGTDERQLYSIPGGWSDFELDLAPFGGYSSFESVGECGVALTYPIDPATFAYSDFDVFNCGDALGYEDQAASPTRSEMQVDGSDAYFADGLYTYSAPHYPSDPLPTMSADPATGLGSVSSQQTLAKCSPGGAFPPDSTNCANYVPTGVRLDHTGTALGAGDLLSTADTFVSVDGQAHDLDLLYSTRTGLTTGTWRFPDETSFTGHIAGDEYSGFAAGPSAVQYDQAGATYGVFAWGAPPDKVTFAAANKFEAHYVLHVPAGGSSTIRFAYGSDFTLDQIDALMPAAIAAVTPPPPAPSPPAPVAPITHPIVPVKKPHLKFSAKSNGNGTVTITFKAPGAGTLSGRETARVARSAKKRTKTLTVSKAHKRVKKAGTVKLVLKLNKHGRKIFRSKHRLRTTLAITFKPKVGSATKLKARHLTLKLKKKKHHKHA